MCLSSRSAALPPHAHIAGFAADDLSHLLAELMENATASSPPDVPVEVSGWLLENGEVMLSVQDEGIGMTGERMTALNSRLAEFDPEAAYESYDEGDEGLGLGLYVVARLAHRHGVRVQLREQKQGGVAAVVVLPKSLLTAAPTSAVPASGTGPVTGAPHSFSLPGADAEVNSNVLSGRSQGGDPLVDLAEKAVRHAAAESPAETTMELLAPVPAPEEPDPVPEEPSPPAPTAAETEAATEHTRADEEPLTDKGLPKRTPKITAPTVPAPRQRNSSVDADALRRRLGGFRRGAEAGYRDVEAEIQEQTGETRLPASHSTASEEATGGTAEEASS